MKAFAKFVAGTLVWGWIVSAWAEAPATDLLWTTARVADASDRAYEPVAISLIDHAASSVVLAMYYLKDGDDDRQPVNRLLNDLREAAQRGVRVEVYLNTKFAGAAAASLDRPWVARLRAAGVTVTGLTPSRRWHGKLLIVDERYVLEGSTNWSVEALKTNGESNTVMDAPALAQQKLARVRVWGVPLPAAPAPVRPDPPAPETVSVPLAWLARGGVMTQMVTRDDERGFDVLLLLLRRAAAERAPAFAVDLTRLGRDSGAPPAQGTIRIHVDMLTVIQRLHRRYAIVTIQTNPRRAAWVSLTMPDGPRVIMPGRFTAPEALTRQSAEATYLALLTEALRQSEGVDASTMTLAALSARTGLTMTVLSKARRELAAAGGS